MAVTKPGLKETLATKAAGGEVATTSAKPRTMADQIQMMVPQFARAMPKHLSADKLARLALTALRTTPKLGECTPGSFFGALMQCAGLGLEPNLIGHAYLVPYRDRKSGQYVCQFIPGYRGLLDLVRRSGEVIGSPRAEIVYENDMFKIERGMERDEFVHVPYYLREDAKFEDGGAIRGAYLHVRYKAGGADVFYMPIDKIEKRRGRSAAKDSGPWQTDYEAMVLKTVVRAHFSWLPVSIEVASKLMAADETVTTIDPTLLEVKTTTLIEDREGDVIDVQIVGPSDEPTKEEPKQ